MSKKRITCLNPDNEALENEVLIDVWTTGLGAYCGSFHIEPDNSDVFLHQFNKREHYTGRYATIRVDTR